MVLAVIQPIPTISRIRGSGPCRHQNADPAATAADIIATGDHIAASAPGVWESSDVAGKKEPCDECCCRSGATRWIRQPWPRSIQAATLRGWAVARASVAKVWRTPAGLWQIGLLNQSTRWREVPWLNVSGRIWALRDPCNWSSPNIAARQLGSSPRSTRPGAVAHGAPRHRPRQSPCNSARTSSPPSPLTGCCSSKAFSKGSERPSSNCA